MTQRTFEDIAAQLRKHKANEEALTARLKEQDELFSKARADYVAAEQAYADAKLDIGDDLTRVRSAIQAATQALRDVPVTTATPAPEAAAEAVEIADDQPEAARAEESQAAEASAAAERYAVNPFTGATVRFGN